MNNLSKGYRKLVGQPGPTPNPTPIHPDKPVGLNLGDCGSGYKSPAEYSALETSLQDQMSRAWALQKENEQLKKVLGVIAQDIGSTHAATKAKEALKALRNEHTI